MRDLFKLLFAVLFPIQAQAVGPVDVVQIDTGNSIERSGFLNMPVNCLSCWNEHGTKMATALEEQLEALGTRPIVAKQIVWKNQEDIIKAVYAAAIVHPKVILMSLNGESPSIREYMAISHAASKGILIIVAAGNEGRPRPGYPASYDLPCLISVSTTDFFGFKATYANSGDTALPEMGLNEKGTSFSTARMGAYAIEKFQKNPSITCNEVETQLKAEHPPARLALKYQ